MKPAWSSLRAGAWTVTALTDAAPAPAPVAYSFPTAPVESRPALAARWFPDGEFRTRFGCWLLRTTGRNVLVDAGIGPGPVTYFPGLAGRLEAALREQSVALADIDLLVFTHLHLDHLGWAPWLPNAAFAVAEAEWAHWADGGEAAGKPHHVAAFRTSLLPLAARVRCLPAGGAAAEGVVLLPAPGHTPGHCGVLVANRLLIAGDLWHNPAQVAEPTWCHRADHDPGQAVATRHALGRRALAEQWVVGAGHFEVPFGRVTAQGFEPAMAQPG